MSGINAGSIYAELILKGDQFFTALKTAEGKTTAFQGKLQGFQRNTKEIGTKLTKGLTLPIVGVGTAATLLGINFQSGMSEVGAISGATGKDLERLEEKARLMGATTKFSATNASEGLKYMAMAGWDTNQMIDGLDGVLNLAAASGEDLGLTADIVTDALTAFGLEAKDSAKFADLLASTSSNSNTNVAMMGETFKYVAPLFGALGYSAEDAALATGLMANAGIKGSQAGTTLRGAITRLVKPTKESGTAMDKLGITMADANGEMKPFDQIMKELRYTFKDLTKEQQAQYAASLFGQEGMSGMLAIINASDADFEKLTKSTTDYTGAAEEMARVMEDNLKGKLNNLRSAVEEAGLKIYDLLLPAFMKAAEWAQKVVDKFNGMTESQQKLALKVAVVAAAIGPLLLIFSTMAGVVLKIHGLFTLLSAGFTAISAAATTAGAATAGATAPFWAIGGAAKAGALLFNPWVAGAAAVALGAVWLAKKLKGEAVPAVDMFGDEVSDTTKKAVTNFTDMQRDASVALKELAWSQKAVTKEMAADMVAKQTEITTTLLTAIDTRQTSEIEEANKQFSKIEALDERQQANVLERINKKYERESTITKEGGDKINAIYESAAARGTKISSSEAEQIERIRKGMTVTAVRVMSESQAEQKIILEKIRNQAGTITAREAAEVAKNSETKRKAVVDEANAQYDETYIWAVRQRDEAGTLSKEEADAVIKDAARKRDDSVKEAEEMHKEVIKEAKAQSGEHQKEVDWETGEIKKKWEVLRDEVGIKAKELGAKVTTNFKEAWGIQMQGIRDFKKDFGKAFKETMNDQIQGAKDFKRDLGIKISETWNDQMTGIRDFKRDFVAAFKQTIADQMQGARDFKRDLGIKFGEVWRDNTEGIRGFKRDAVQLFQEVKEGIKLKVDGMVADIKAMPGRMADGVRRGKTALVKSFTDMWAAVVRGISSPVNKVIDGANWILGKFGVAKKQQISHWVSGYAKGTDGHLGGPALVNDQKGGTYREAIRLPDGETFIPEGRNVLFEDMPIGTKVLPAAATKKLYKYEGGVGDWIKGMYSKGKQTVKKVGDKFLDIWEYAKNPGKMVQAVLSKFVDFDGAGSLTAKMGKGLVNRTTSSMVDWAKDLFSKNEDPALAAAGAAGGLGGPGSSNMGGLGFAGFRKSSPFGYRIHPIFHTKKLHTGVDLAAPSGTPVRAQHPGMVTHGRYTGGYGNLVKTKAGTTEYLYAHLSRIIAKVGSQVKAGQLLGLVGSTGNSTGPHLHFERRVNGRPVHPGYARGTNYARGGLAVVGEQGREILDIPRGSKVHSNAETERLLGIDYEKLGQIFLEAIESAEITAEAFLDGELVTETVSNTMALRQQRRRS